MIRRIVIALWSTLLSVGIAQAQTVTCNPSSVSLTLSAGTYDPSSSAYISPTPSAQFQFKCSAAAAANYYFKLTITGTNPRRMNSPGSATNLSYQLCSQVVGNSCTQPWTSTNPTSGGPIPVPINGSTTVVINVYALVAPQQSVEPSTSNYLETITGIQLFLCRNNPCP